MDIIEFLDISSCVPQPYGENEVKKTIRQFYEDLSAAGALDLEAEYILYKYFKE